MRPEIPTLTLAALLLAAPLLEAQPTPWVHPDGRTHYYEVVVPAQPLTWIEAQGEALARGGHLATPTSAAENALLFALVDAPGFWLPDGNGRLRGPWLGGLQRPGAAEPAGGWVTVEAEPLNYLAWSTSEPLDQTGSEDHLCFASANGLRAAEWGAADGEVETAVAYIVEWSRPPAQNVGLTRKRSGNAPGFTLLPPLVSDGTVHLLDESGRAVHAWATPDAAALTNHLLPDGSLLRSSIANASSPQQQWNGVTVGGLTGRIQRIDWDGNVVWQFDLANGTEYLHHDICPMPDGNILAIRYQRKTTAECIQAGRDPAQLSDGELWPDSIIEIDPNLNGGSIVWEWNLWDHLIQDHDPSKDNYGVVADHPERVDINFFWTPGADWTHFNTVDYNPIRDEILVTVHALDEIWVIDHSTTTAEAATSSGGNSGRGGDLLYRWGNPQAYRQGTEADRRLFHPHDAQWIAPGLPGAGNILIFNNGWTRPGLEYSSIDELTPPLDAQGNYVLASTNRYGPESLAWSYAAPNPSDFYSRIMSGTQRLPNGNTLVTSATQGIVFQVTPQGERTWEYHNPIVGGLNYEQGSPYVPCVPYGPCTPIFKTRHYGPNHPALASRDLRRGAPVEPYALEHEARFGNVRSATGPAQDVLRVNGRTGDVFRQVHVEATTPIEIEIAAPSGGPVPAHHVLFVYLGEPTVQEVRDPFGNQGYMTFPIGTFGTPAPPVVTLLDSTQTAFFGPPALPLTPQAPGAIPAGVVPPGTYTLQGVIQDLESEGPGFSVTNAVVLKVLP